MLDTTKSSPKGANNIPPTSFIPFNPLLSIKELYFAGYKRAAFWKVCENKPYPTGYLARLKLT